MKDKLTYLLIINCVIFSSCINNSEKVLNDIESYIDQYPDSALVVLDSIQYETDLSASDINRLNLLTVIAKDKVKESIKESTIIYRVVRYYEQGGDLLRSAQSNLYAGRVCQERGDLARAMKYYINAEEYANKLKEQDKLKGLIQSEMGTLLCKEFHIQEAIARYFNSLKYFERNRDSHNIALTYNHLGICYSFIEDKKDSANYYFNKGFTIAHCNNDIELKMMCCENIALAFINQDRIEKSIQYFNEALSYAPTKSDSMDLYLNIGRAYNIGGNIDSLMFYIDRIQEYGQDNIPYVINKNINSLKSDILKEKQEYKEALELYEKLFEYLDYEHNKFKSSNMLDIKRKYKFEIMQNKHNEALIARQRIIIGLLLLVVVVITLSIANYTKSIKDKKALDEANNRIIEFNEVIENYNSEKDSLKTIVLNHFAILKKAALIDNLIRKSDKDNGQKVLAKYNQIIYGQNSLDWDVLYNTMNKVYDGQLEKMRNRFPLLNDTDFKICCPVYAKFSRTEISLLLGLSASTISSRNSSIRKKLGIDEYGNIAEYIKRLE